MDCVNNIRNTKCLVNKNLLILKRRKYLTTCEIFFPLITVLLLSYINHITPIKETLKVSFQKPLNSSNINYQSSATYSSFLIPFIESDIDTNEYENILKIAYLKGSITQLIYYQLLKHGPPQNIQQSYQIGQYLNNIKNCNFKNQNQAVALGPKNNSHVQYFKELFEKTLKYDTIIFDNNDDINKYMESDYYSLIQQICFGIYFENTDNDKWKYLIRYKNNNHFYNSDVPYNLENIYNKEEKQKFNILRTQLWTNVLYKFNGYYTLQNIIDNYILNQQKNQENSQNYQQIVTTIQSQPLHPEFINQNDNNFRYIIDIFTMIPFIVIYSSFLNKILTEKQEKITNIMYIMGLNKIQFYFSWYITYSIIFQASSFFISLALYMYFIQYFRTFFTLQNFYLIFLLFSLYTQQLIFQVLFIQIFFNNAKFGFIFGILLFILEILFKQYILIFDQASYFILLINSFSPYNAMYLGLVQFLKHQLRYKSVNDIYLTVNQYNLFESYSFLFCQSLILIVFIIIIEICLSNKKFQKNITNRFNQIFNKIIKIQSQYQNIDEQYNAQYEIQEKNNQTLKIKSLTKIYQNKNVALKNIDLTMYSGQIFVLLGHNGAGKTTLIDILTSQQQIQYGNVQIFGNDLIAQNKNLQKQIGYCPQYDILFNDLLVRENLELFANLKGIQSNKIQDEIRQALVKVDLLSKENDYVQNLSGGQKRRLQTGIAYLGDSRLIILDEPTSGIDSSNRRFIWNIIKENKNDKIILLTTHFMDEAEFLCDRLGIIKSGEMQCVGNLVDIKNKYQDFKYVTVVLKKDSKIDSIISIAKEYNGKIIHNQSSEITFQIPLQENIKIFLKYLDQNQEDLNFECYGIRNQNLEEIFINVFNQTNDNSPIKVQKSQKDDQKLSVKSDKKQDDFEQNNKIRYQKFFNIQFSQIQALINRRIQNFKADKLSLFFEIILPIMILFLGMGISTINYYEPHHNKLLNYKIFEKQTLQYSTNKNFTNQTNLNQIMNLAQVNANYVKSNDLQDFENYIYDNENPDFLSSIYFKFHQIIDKDNFLKLFSKFNNQSINQQDIDYYKNLTNNINQSVLATWYNNLYDTRALLGGVVYTNQINQAIIRNSQNNSNFELQIENQPLPYTKEQLTGYAQMHQNLFGILFSLAFTFLQISIIEFLVSEKQKLIKHQQHLQGINIIQYWFCNFIVDYIKYIILSLVSIYFCDFFQQTIITDSNLNLKFFQTIFLFGFQVLGFIYCFSQFFNNPQLAQISIFIFSILFGVILSQFQIQYNDSQFKHFEDFQFTFLKLIPQFLLGNSIFALQQQSNYQHEIIQLFDYKTIQKKINTKKLIDQNQQFNIYMSFFYFILLILIEIFKINFKCYRKQKIKVSQLDQDQDNFIKTSNLRKVYDNKKLAVDDISFQLKKGEVFGLLGVNGAGKSTTFKMLTNYEKPTSGNIEIDNLDLDSHQFQATKNIGYCPQFEGLYSYLTVKQHLYFFCGIQCIKYKYRLHIVNFLLDKLNLTIYEDYLVHQLSGGNKRKLSIAIACLGFPKVILLDEPSTGMDPLSRINIWKFIRKNFIKNKKSSIILTTHSLEDAEQICTKIAIMKDGKFSCKGSVQQLKQQFSQKYEIDLILYSAQQEDLQNIELNQYPLNLEINYNQIQELLKKFDLNQTDLLEFNQSNFIKSLQYDLIKTDQIYQIILQIKNGQQLKKFFIENFQNSELFENFLNFYRFKIDIKQKISEIYEQLENNQNLLKIKHFNIKQLSLEQIFNQIANN